ERGQGDRRGRERGRRGDEYPRRGRDNRNQPWPARTAPPNSPPPVTAPVVGQTEVSPPTSPPPPPQNVAESGSTGSGYGIPLEPTPDEPMTPSPAIATEPLAPAGEPAQAETSEPTLTSPPAANQPMQRVTTNESSFDLEDFGFTPALQEPKPMPV